MLADLKYALRQLAKSPVFTVVVVVSLALGIGANTAIFGLLDDLVLNSLPVKNPDELVLFQWLPGTQGSRPLRSSGGTFGDDDIDTATGRRLKRIFPIRSFEELRRDHSLLSETFAFAGLGDATLTIDNMSETVGFGQLVSGDYCRALGVKAYRGRALTPEDDQPGAPPAAMLSYAYWQARFAADPAVIGKILSVNRVPVAIVGITPRNFAGATLDASPPEIFLPLALAPQLLPPGTALSAPGAWWLQIMGRLQPGITPEHAQAGLDGLFVDSAKAGVSHPDDPPHLRFTLGGKGRTKADLRHNRQLLAPLMGMAGLVLLTAAVNAANLLLVRGASRRREFAVRLALGAGRRRIIRQLLVESVLLSLGGAALGLLISRWGVALLATLTPPADNWVLDHLTLDWRVLGFTAAIGLLTGIGFGLAPALRATRLNLIAEFQGGQRSLGGGGRSRLSKTLLIAQVALAIVLLVVADMFGQTVRNLRSVDLGFNKSHLLFFSLNGAPGGSPSPRIAHIHASVLDRIATLPGVQGATFSGYPFVSFYGWEKDDFSVPGRPDVAGHPDQVICNQVGPNFFQTYEIPILLGRGIATSDGESAPKVAVVNETLARKYFAGESPIGETIILNYRILIVGVVRDAKQNDLRAPVEPTVFVPFPQSPRVTAHYSVRTIGSPQTAIGAIRKAVSEVDPNLPLNNVRTADEQMQWRIEGERIYASLAVALGLVALVLVCVGLYGLMSYTVLRRTSEIGLRMALGALPGRVLRMVLGESLVLVGAGVGLGIGAAGGISRLISSSLYGLTANDPFIYLGVSLLLVVVASLTCLVPACRATRIDPVIALRTE